MEQHQHQNGGSQAQIPQQQEENGVSVYSKVIYKKKEGSLTLTADGISFSVSDSPLLHVNFNILVKHQVSPASYLKALLKLVIKQYDGSNSNATFQFPQRAELERARKEITRHLVQHNSHNGQKRTLAVPSTTAPVFGGNLDPTALAVTRASLLAAHPSLRQQHYHLVQETATVSEDDFWETHHHLVQEEYARIAGMAKAGTSSLLQSHLPIAKGGRVKLGVEEMRQIFIMYPAVHKAYEEKVPLELSDEQFWRKYLESEYFHRDRGRMGTAARNHGIELQQNNNNKKQTGPSIEEQDARAAAVGTDDIFSRYAQKLRQEQEAQGAVQSVDASGTSAPEHPRRHRWGRQLAVGQFDLASTFETERANVLENRDMHPLNPDTDGGKGSRVIRKYNRHWSMVLHPEDAVAGANLMNVARKSAKEALPDDSDAKAGGGTDEEMRRLVDFAEATQEEANHASGLGLLEAAYAPLNLKNVEGYYSSAKKRPIEENSGESMEEAKKRYAVCAGKIATKAREMANACKDSMSRTALPANSFPPPVLGANLLKALTKKFEKDSKSESESLAMANKLPEDFRKNLQAYFRRSSELLRHFFGLRRLQETQGTVHHSQKLARIVESMETFYREMETMRKEFPHSDDGERMRKMCLPIMDQLDWAFQLHREGSGGGGGGGFVTVEQNY